MKVHRPRAVVVENVFGMVSSHARTVHKILRSFSKMDYQTWHSVLNCKDHGVPHDRRRLIIVAVRADSVRRELTWPRAAKTGAKARDLLDPLGNDDFPFQLPDKVEQPRARSLVCAAVRKCKAMNINVKYNDIFIDADCSKRFATFGVNEIKCLTASRGATGGPWILSRGRRMTTSELFAFQGMHDDDDYAGWDHVVTRRMMGHMLGNTVSLPITERVLAAALYASGLHSRLLAGRWHE